MSANSSDLDNSQFIKTTPCNLVFLMSVFDNNKFVTSIKSINVVIHNIFESTTCSILIEGCCETSSFGNMLFAFFMTDDNNNLCLPHNILRI
ncbi:hypothetical protein F2Q69_00012335 [Brassica cretica]|uniref:Uncharacterized protein n=1 Tax=Brassica cretica TaxID=69181 RepID=A0A8S9QW83_BRACR|nr:hypothetical protein F2Q69_00012335 [Brassica cretica]